ncbi:MAG TPA: cysteine protease [Nitratifractor sp.]|nr:cysteine protease [Nitratifractor sp.]
MANISKNLVFINETEAVGTGWIPPLPDLRDYTDDSAEIKKMVKELKRGKTLPRALPKKTDLRQWCSPIENQGALGSCTAHAAAGVIEYFQRRAHGKYIDVSRLFIYKTTRNLLGWVGDTGAYLRTTMASIAVAGVPPERYWPYTTRVDPGPSQERTFDTEPDSFVYAVADNYEAIRYFRHGAKGGGKDGEKVLKSVKKYLLFGIPSMFGFYGFDSFYSGDKPGHIPLPCDNEQAQWGHAIVAVGYDDNKEIKNRRCGTTTKGALLIRNSWGTGWGDAGYGWLPYEYVLHGYAHDFWSMLSMKWVDTGEFGL